MSFSLRSALVAVCVAIFSFSLVSLPWAHLATVTFLDRDTVKGWLEKSGSYNKLSDYVLDSSSYNKGESTASGGGLPTDDPRIQQIFHDALQPTFSKENSNKTIDGVYDWLEGKTEKLQFASDLQSIKQRLADGVSTYASEKLSSLPACTAEQTAAMASSGVDPWNAECLPAGVSKDQIVADIKNQILTSKDIPGESSQTSADPTVEMQQNLEGVRTSYQLAVIGPIVFGTAALLALVAALVLSTDKRKALRRISVTTMGAGVVTVISAIAVYFVMKAVANVGGEFVQGILVIISGDIVKVLAVWGIGLLMIGAIVWAFLRFVSAQDRPLTNKK